jgi:hypothetical protein
MELIRLQTSRDVLTFYRTTGCLLSLRRLADPDTELLAPGEGDPAFLLQYLDAEGKYQALDSRQAVGVAAEALPSELRLTFRRVGGLDLDVTLRVRATTDDCFSRWQATVRNGCGLRIVDLQFPFVVIAQQPDTAVLVPAGFGELYEGGLLGWLPADDPRGWQFLPENGNSPHYPGRVFAQFLAASSARGGVYLGCDDTEGNVKFIRATRRETGIRLGVAHVGDWPDGGQRTLEYEVLLGSFEGDWYDAAELYRRWALRQKWSTPLTQRTDVPEWLLDSPPHITVRLQGYVDAGPAPPIEEFLPYEKIIPLLEGVADAVRAPLVAVLMSWERGGPWVYPDCFPPVGGDESLANFCRLARERDWHVGSFCNGTRWVTQHLFNGYDGHAYFEEHGGAESVCRRSDGELWAEHWDGSWRPSYITCMSSKMTRTIAQDFVRRLLGWGMESIQYFDQNCNAATFPCFSADHGHPRMPGKWMARAMEAMIGLFAEATVEAGETAVIQSTECPCNEYCLPLFQQSDVRVSPPTSGLANFAPVYHYLYHECSILHGMMSTGAEPHALEIRNAWNGVLGEIPGAVLIGDGTLLNRDTFNWADWEPKVGDNAAALAMLGAVTWARQGEGRPSLVYGRMQRPASVQGIPVLEWDHDGRHHAVPAVAHAAWQGPDGRHAVVLANWTQETRSITVKDPRLGTTAELAVYGGETRTEVIAMPGAGAEVALPPLSCSVLTARQSAAQETPGPAAN